MNTFQRCLIYSIAFYGGMKTQSWTALFISLALIIAFDYGGKYLAKVYKINIPQK